MNRKDRGGAENGILNQVKVTETYHEPNAMLSTMEETNMKVTSNVLSECPQHTGYWHPIAGSTTDMLGSNTIPLIFLSLSS